jgi:hypothetical protein
MLINKKVSIFGIVLLFCCSLLVVALEGSVPVKVNIEFECSDGVCRYKVLNIPMPSGYTFSDLQLKLEANYGSICYNLHDWSIKWCNGDDWGVKVKGTWNF